MADEIKTKAVLDLRRPDHFGIITCVSSFEEASKKYDIYGKTLKERAKALIAIAHPNFREELERQSFENKLLQ